MSYLKNCVFNIENLLKECKNEIIKEVINNNKEVDVSSSKK